MKSKSEKICKLKFDEFVRERSSCKSILWECVAHKHEPPDYFLHLDDTKYAVEVTTLVGKTKIGPLKLSQIGIIASLWQIVDEVEVNARSGNFLHGAYLVSFSQPITNLRDIQDQLSRDLLAYVKTTQSMSAAPEQVVFESAGQKCTIRKLHDQKSYIGKAGPGREKWEDEIVEEVCSLLEERICSKHHKLSRITDPKILLLYDAYHFANMEIYKRCAYKISSLLTLFHTVFIVQSNRDSFTLSSINTDWL
ncbi:MAG: hypothetical protein GXP39_18920 [Chloroflexi bacterium]|nr:hypothetical protein [Chloroflexota bacterium]